jgi:hypothetical protein
MISHGPNRLAAMKMRNFLNAFLTGKIPEFDRTIHAYYYNIEVPPAIRLNPSGEIARDATPPSKAMNE